MSSIWGKSEELKGRNGKNNESIKSSKTGRVVEAVIVRQSCNQLL